MKNTVRSKVCLIVILVALIFTSRDALANSADYPTNTPVSNQAWPPGMTNLVNITNRVHGFFVNDSDVFSFSGSATNFEAFLADYAKIEGTVHQHRLILHEGMAAASSPWDKDKSRVPCDWELHGLMNGWRNGVITNYTLEVHFWTGGKIALDKVSIPKNIEVIKP
jgi:hypothetical protein